MNPLKIVVYNADDISEAVLYPGDSLDINDDLSREGNLPAIMLDYILDKTYELHIHVRRSGDYPSKGEGKWKTQ